MVWVIYSVVVSYVIYQRVPFFIILCRLQQKMAVTHLDCPSTYFYSSTHLHKTSKIYLMFFASDPQITTCYLFQTWKYWPNSRLNWTKIQDPTFFLSPFCEWLVTGMSESPVHGEEAALGKHIWGSSLFLLILKCTTLLGCCKVDQVIEFKLSILPCLTKPQDSVSSGNFTHIYIYYMLFLADFLPESWSNCMGHTEQKSQPAVSSPLYFHTYI